MLYRREGLPEEDEFVLCTVTKILNHAVFVNLDEYDKGGLIHISEVAPGRIRNIRDFVDLNKKVVCKILRINKERGHIDLSLRRVSDMERKRKLEMIKQEQKAEKIVEMVAKQLKKKVVEVYEAITHKVFEHYSYLHEFFREVATDETDIKKLLKDKKVVELVEPLVKERFKPAKVNIKGTLMIKTYDPKGVELVKDTLKKASKVSKNSTQVSISYLGGGNYKVSLEALNYKEAESTLEHLTKVVESCIKSAKFARAEE